MSPFNRAAWDGEKPLVEHTPDLTVDGRPAAAGDYVLPKAALGSDATSRWTGEGVIWSISRWEDPHTGEIDDLFHTAHNDRGELVFGEIHAQNVGDRTRTSRLDAAGIVVLCARAVVKSGSKTAPRIKALFDVAWAVMRGDDLVVAAPPLLDDQPIHVDLADRLATSTTAHRDRNTTKETTRAR